MFINITNKHVCTFTQLHSLCMVEVSLNTHTQHVIYTHTWYKQTPPHRNAVLQPFLITHFTSLCNMIWPPSFNLFTK